MAVIANPRAQAAAGDGVPHGRRTRGTMLARVGPGQCVARRVIPSADLHVAAY